jgi:hypothetical protein
MGGNMKADGSIHREISQTITVFTQNCRYSEYEFSEPHVIHGIIFMNGADEPSKIVGKGFDMSNGGRSPKQVTSEVFDDYIYIGFRACEKIMRKEDYTSFEKGLNQIITSASDKYSFLAYDVERYVKKYGVISHETITGERTNLEIDFSRERPKNTVYVDELARLALYLYWIEEFPASISARCIPLVPTICSVFINKSGTVAIKAIVDDAPSAAFYYYIMQNVFGNSGRIEKCLHCNVPFLAIGKKMTCSRGACIRDRQRKYKNDYRKRAKDGMVKHRGQYRP